MKLSADFSGANIYVEKHRELQLLYSGASTASSASAGRPDSRRHCFYSHAGQVALFVESDPSWNDPIGRQSAQFEFDLQLKSAHEELDPWDGMFLFCNVCHF